MALIWAKNLFYFYKFSCFIFYSPFIKWSMKTLRSSVLEESSMMKMPLHMKSYENLMIICIAMSHRKLIYDCSLCCIHSAGDRDLGTRFHIFFLVFLILLFFTYRKCLLLFIFLFSFLLFFVSSFVYAINSHSTFLDIYNMDASAVVVG